MDGPLSGTGVATRTGSGWRESLQQLALNLAGRGPANKGKTYVTLSVAVVLWHP